MRRPVTHKGHFSHDVTVRVICRTCIELQWQSSWCNSSPTVGQHLFSGWPCASCWLIWLGLTPQNRTSAAGVEEAGTSAVAGTAAGGAAAAAACTSSTTTE